MALIVHMSCIVCSACGHARHATHASAHTDYFPNSCLEQILDLVILRENTSVPFNWYYLSPFAPCATLSGSQYRPTFEQQYLENGKIKHCLCQTFFKEYSTSFLMVCRLIDFALLVLKLLMFKVCVIIGISKMEFFNFSGTERVNIC